MKTGRRARDPPLSNMLIIMKTGRRACDPPLSNMMQGNGGGGRHVSVQLNKQVLDCGSTGELCELIETHVAEFSLAQATLPA